MPKFISALIVIFFFAFSANSYAEDLFDILKRMSDADHSQNYQGTFILRKSDKLSTLRVTHGVDEKGDWENLQSLSGESRNIYRRNKQVISVYPEREILTIRYTDENRSLHPKLPGNLDQLELFYSMERLDDDRIANHQALVVDLLPIDQYRYGYRYWVDKNTGMLLRCDLYDEKKTVIEQMMFTSLDYLSNPPVKAFDLQKYEGFQQRDIRELEAVESSGEKLQWAVNRLPKGFMLTQSILRNSKPRLQAQQQASSQLSQPKAETSSQDVSTTVLATYKKTSAESAIQASESAAQNPDLLHMVYSDGLASVSVFIEKNQGAMNHLQGASSMGAVNAYGNSIGHHFVTVVGEVPAKTVQAMAKSTIRLQ